MLAFGATLAFSFLQPVLARGGRGGSHGGHGGGGHGSGSGAHPIVVGGAGGGDGSGSYGHMSKKSNIILGTRTPPFISCGIIPTYRCSPCSSIHPLPSLFRSVLPLLLQQ